MEERKDVLTRSLAQHRASTINNVSYDISLSFVKHGKKYSGRCIIYFNFDRILNKNKNLILDFIGNVKNLSLNGQKIKHIKKSANIEIPQKFLKHGANFIEIGYQNDYNTTGDGLQHFTDPEDSREYIYTHLEPYSAHRVFPCFDQPDLKASFRLKVESPKEWELISNTYEDKKRVSAQTKTVEFKSTPRISTYLFHISAGPYIIFKDSYRERNGKVIPLRLLCRESLKKHFIKNVKSQAFRYTKQGLRFYSDFFDFPYPFEKYDQIFVPELNIGAMENVGAVTFTESLVFRHRPTRTEEISLANIILHEMCHMWFGDLVTMKWWDDLWLNESFADYLSYYALVKAAKFNDGWQSFYRRKAWAYNEDQMSTTHPIAANAPDTDVAFINFDGISYAKGAAVLKQLVYFLGENKFRRGIRAYFKKYQWKNTELKDFMHSMESASGKQLEGWSKSWISSLGVNTTFPRYSIKNGKIKEFFIVQEKNNSILKEHRTKVAFLYENKKGNECDVEKIFEASYGRNNNKLDGAMGLKKPSIVLTNYDDQDYAKTLLDEESLEYACKNLEKIKDPLTRQMVLGAIWQMIRDARIDPRKYLDIVLKSSMEENELVILESHFMRAAKILSDYISTDCSDFKFYLENIKKLALGGLESARKENKNAWFSLLLNTSARSESADELVMLLEDKKKIKDFWLNSEQRWASVIILESRGHREADNLLRMEKKIDPSDTGRKSAFKAEVSRMKNKQKHWEMFLKGKKYSLDYMRRGMEGFYWKSQIAQMGEYSKLFFDVVKGIYATRDRQYSKDFFENLFPAVFVDAQALQKIINRTEKLLRDRGLHELLKKDLRQEHDELMRSLKILKKYS